MNLTERGRSIIRNTLLTSALVSPFGTFTQAEVNAQDISPVQEIAKTELPYTTDSDKWVVVKGYTSDYRGSQDYRVKNITAGSNAINNWFWDFAEIDGKLVKSGKNVIKPGETFSINSILGKVTDYVIGYAIGPDLRPVPIYGGGICQIPTTVFVASLEVGLFAEERINHSYNTGAYFGDRNDSKEFGKDATVYIADSDSEQSLDLVIRNTYDYPIRYFLQTAGQTLRVEVLGPPELKTYYVEIEGPTMLSPFPGVPVKELGRFVKPARTIVTQYVWRDSSKQEKIFEPKEFKSSYQAAPDG